jgi:hypothetical protein
MDNYFIKPEFILEKFQFKENFVIPSIKNINAEKVVDLYESMRTFFPLSRVINKQQLLRLS